MDTNPLGYALGYEDGEALWFFGTLATFKATAEQTGGQYSLIEQVAPRGVATPLHVQPEDHESFYVLEGELTFYLEDGQPIPASAGSFVHISKGTAHAFQVDSQTARFLDLTTPSTNTSCVRLASLRRGESSRRRVRRTWRRSTLPHKSTESRY